MGTAEGRERKGDILGQGGVGESDGQPDLGPAA